MKEGEKKAAEVESSHDEDEFDETSPDSSLEKEVGSKKARGTGRQQRGRKAVTVPSPPAPEEQQTRRGGKTPSASKRGRGGRAATARVVPQPPQTSLPTAMPSPAPPTAMRQQKTSESDVYEFHDDSGEELVKSGDVQRPRLIMTIKSSNVTTSVNTQPITTSPLAISTPTVVQNTPVTAPVVQQPVAQPAPVEAAPETAPTLIPPSPNSSTQVPSPAPSDEFAQPNNTRKSRRLQEKDGTRTSVDDTIDDVIRNMTPNQAQQPNNRRATRQTTPVQVTTTLPIQSLSLHHQKRRNQLVAVQRNCKRIERLQRRLKVRTRRNRKHHQHLSLSIHHRSRTSFKSLLYHKPKLRVRIKSIRKC